MKVKESEKVGLKLNIQKTKIMASGPITSWQTDGETVKTVADSNNSQFLMLNGTYVIYYSLNPIMIHIGFFFF